MYFTSEKVSSHTCRLFTVLIGVIIYALVSPVNIFSETPNKPVRPARRSTSPIVQVPDSIELGKPVKTPAMVVVDSISAIGDSLSVVPVDSLAIVNAPDMPLAAVTDTASMVLKDNDEPQEAKFTFTPDPTRAVWMSALFPGLGQLYNRRYWKLPIVVGAFMGLGYATSWNNTMLKDYTTAYSDIMDNDPSTKSYMDFFAPTVKEEDLDKTWLTNLLRTRKNYYRRNRDLCIICMVGVYLLSMVDAYVDASLSHFDISPDLSVDVSATLLNNDFGSRPGIGLYWAVNF
ncbi:MAG: hypothetical protein K2G33_09750 [Duncaniella sp.]|nr:hypothetical protein [Duncaniella sp.]